MTAFAKNESLYWRIWTKYKSRKLFWRILGDNKPNKLENRGKKTVNAIRRVGQKSGTLFVETQWNPSRWAFCLQSLAYFDDFYQWIYVCLFLTRYSRLSKVNIGQYKAWTADYGLRTGYKIHVRTRYKTRTGKYGLGIKHELGIRRGLRTGYKYGLRTTWVKAVLIVLGKEK